jgi:hypothetical protein
MLVIHRAEVGGVADGIDPPVSTSQPVTPAIGGRDDADNRSRDELGGVKAEVTGIAK